MAKYYVPTTYHPVLFYLNKRNLTKSDLCNHLNIGKVRLNGFIKDPSLIYFKHIIQMAGLFGIPAEELFYLLIRNKPKLNKEGKWYLEEIYNKYK